MASSAPRGHACLAAKELRRAIRRANTGHSSPWRGHHPRVRLVMRVCTGRASHSSVLPQWRIPAFHPAVGRTDKCRATSGATVPSPTILDALHGSSTKLAEQTSETPNRPPVRLDLRPQSTHTFREPPWPSHRDWGSRRWACCRGPVAAGPRRTCVLFLVIAQARQYCAHGGVAPCGRGAGGPLHTCRCRRPKRQSAWRSRPWEVHDRPSPPFVRAAAAKSSIHHRKTSGLRLQPWRSPVEGVIWRLHQLPCTNMNSDGRVSQVGSNSGCWNASSVHGAPNRVVPHTVVCMCISPLQRPSVALSGCPIPATATWSFLGTCRRNRLNNLAADANTVTGRSNLTSSGGGGEELHLDSCHESRPSTDSLGLLSLSPSTSLASGRLRRFSSPTTLSPWCIAHVWACVVLHEECIQRF